MVNQNTMIHCGTPFSSLTDDASSNTSAFGAYPFATNQKHKRDDYMDKEPEG